MSLYMLRSFGKWRCCASIEGFVSRGSLNKDQNHLKVPLKIDVSVAILRHTSKMATPYLWWAWTRAMSRLICGEQTNMEGWLSTGITADTDGQKPRQKSGPRGPKEELGHVHLQGSWSADGGLTFSLPDCDGHLTKSGQTGQRVQNWNTQTVPWSKRWGSFDSKTWLQIKLRLSKNEESKYDSWNHLLEMSWIFYGSNFKNGV